MMIISDAQGVILETIGDTKINHQAESLHLFSGANWSEHSCGTNAIGTALATGMPIQVHANEHYCTTIKRWTCSATCSANVIRDPLSKSILGVLDVSGLKNSYNRQTLALVTSLAAQIEQLLYRQEIENYHILLERYLCFQQSNHSASLLFNRHGQAIQASARMKALLCKSQPIDEQQLKQLFNRLHLDHLEPFLRTLGLQCELYFCDVDHQSTRLGQIVYCLECSSAQERPQLHSSNTDPQIIGQSPALIRVLNRTRQLAKTSISILLSGETGVGKELFARFIHQNSALHAQAFVVINCASMSKELISAELFGYVEGAFTGARKGGMIGKIEQADGGTLFLDEIGELPIDLQSHLLRVIEHGEIYRLGDHQPRHVNFRLICATNRNLKSEVEQKNFRLDLLHRIAVSQIIIPALRDRAEDLDSLLHHYLQVFIKKHALQPLVFSAAAKTQLLRYAWPGNIRELRNLVEAMAVAANGNQINLEDIPTELLSPQSNLAQQDQPIMQRPSCSGLHQLEYELIKRTLIELNGNLSAVARALGLAKSTIYLKINKYHLNSLVSQLRQNKTELALLQP
jgi:transcriptional regulator of acetoin/glycerol metabolism